MRITEAILIAALIFSSVWAVMERQTRFDNEATLRKVMADRKELVLVNDRWSHLFKETSKRANDNLKRALDAERNVRALAGDLLEIEKRLKAAHQQ